MSLAPSQVAVVEYGHVSPSAVEAISRYRDILATTGIEWGLLGPREVDRIWERHILNSAAVAPLLAPNSRVADIGSGAGLPGIPVAILRPDLSVTLVEPLLRRSTFLSETVLKLGLSERVRVVRERAEELAKQIPAIDAKPDPGADHRYDALLSRALAPLDRLIRWCLPLLTEAGEVIAIKGESAQQEVDRHARLLKNLGLTGEVLSCSLHPDIQSTTVVRLRRV